MKETKEEVLAVISKLPELKKEIAKVIVGQDETIDHMLITFLSNGHALLEGVPGLAKTLMIRTLSKCLDLKFSRIQFTPDLMPSDILGTEILEEDHATGKKFFKFNKGPIFANVILADEINRTPPKTQSALLEAMQEKEVTYAGNTYTLDQPFFILATQNPIEQSGTFPLPEAQLDRFLLYIKIGYPGELEEKEVLEKTTGVISSEINSVVSGSEIIEMQEMVRQVPISDDLVDYVNKLVRATRPDTTVSDYVKEWVRWGAGPRAGQAIILASKARALLNQRFAVTIEDIKHVSFPVLRHRIILNFKAESSQVHPDMVTERLLETIKLPMNGKAG